MHVWLTIAEKTTVCIYLDFILSRKEYICIINSFSEPRIAVSSQRSVYFALHWAVLWPAELNGDCTW